MKGQDNYLTLAAGHSILEIKSCLSKIMLSHLKPICCERNENFIISLGHMTKLAATSI